MKRLTKRWEAQPYPNLAGKVICEYKECDSTKSCENCIHGRYKDRLAAYEDRGLEPEEISALCDMDRRAKIAEMLRLEESFGVSIDRLRELAQADREGRCVVLPCKKGDTVWRIVHDATPHITKDRCTNIKVENKEVWVNLIGDRVMGGWNFGKLLFLNEKEAEVALKAREQS